MTAGPSDALRSAATALRAAAAALDEAASSIEPDPGLQRLLSIEETRELLSLSRTALYGLLDRGSLRSVKVGRRRMVPSGDVRQLLERGAP